MQMTYDDLIVKLQAMTPEHRQATVTMYDENADEFYPAILVFADVKCDVLDADHPYLTNDVSMRNTTIQKL